MTRSCSDNPATERMRRVHRSFKFRDFQPGTTGANPVGRPDLSMVAGRRNNNWLLCGPA